MLQLHERPINEFVNNDFRTAAIFEKHGIDFCCRGDKSVGSACAEQGINIDDLLREINSATVQPSSDTVAFNAMELDALADYVVDTHHRYVKEQAPVIMQHISKVAMVHGANHPETIEVRDAFVRLMNELTPHMQKEEMVLFPLVHRLVHAHRNGSSAGFAMIAAPISMMRSEHESAGEELAKIRESSKDFSLPPDACGTFRVSYQELADFERDLHQHIYLENAILFPKALAMATA